MIINRDLARMEIEQLLLRQQSQEFGCFVYSARSNHCGNFGQIGCIEWKG